MKKLLIYLKAYRKEACLAPIFKMLEAVFERLCRLLLKESSTTVLQQKTAHIVFAWDCCFYCLP